MPTLGLIGGIAPASTIDYYRLLIEEYRSRHPEGAYPSILINSIDLQYFLSLVASGDRSSLVEYLLAELDRLAQAGAELGLFASNTPHLVFEEVAVRSPLPLVSIVEATGDAAAARGYKRVGLLGTRVTMEGGFYDRVLARYGVSVVVPDESDRAFVNDRYFGELVNGVFSATTRAGMTAVIDRMGAQHGIEAAVLGGTELPLLFRNGAPLDIPLLDTTELHVKAAATRLWGET